VISDESCEHDESRAPRRLRGTAFWLLGRASRTAQQLTQERLGWKPTHAGLMEDLEKGTYFDGK